MNNKEQIFQTCIEEAKRNVEQSVDKRSIKPAVINSVYKEVTNAWEEVTNGVENITEDIAKQFSQKLTEIFKNIENKVLREVCREVRNNLRKQFKALVSSQVTENNESVSENSKMYLGASFFEGDLNLSGFEATQEIAKNLLGKVIEWDYEYEGVHSKRRAIIASVEAYGGNGEDEMAYKGNKAKTQLQDAGVMQFIYFMNVSSGLHISSVSSESESCIRITGLEVVNENGEIELIEKDYKILEYLGLTPSKDTNAYLRDEINTQKYNIGDETSPLRIVDAPNGKMNETWRSAELKSIASKKNPMTKASAPTYKYVFEGYDEPKNIDISSEKKKEFLNFLSSAYEQVNNALGAQINAVSKSGNDVMSNICNSFIRDTLIALSKKVQELANTTLFKEEGKIDVIALRDFRLKVDAYMKNLDFDVLNVIGLNDEVNTKHKVEKLQALSKKKNANIQRADVLAYELQKIHANCVLQVVDNFVASI